MSEAYLKPQPRHQSTTKIEKVIEAELLDELSPTEIKPKKLKKVKKKKKNTTSLELPSEVAVGKSEAINMRENKNLNEDEMVLEDIKNENRIAYDNDHHTEV